MKDQSSSAVQIHGHVVARRSGQALARMRVEAWDSELTDYQPLSATVTDAEGKFELSLDGAFMRETPDERDPEIFFRVFDGDRLIGTTEGRVSWGREDAGRDVAIEVSAPGIDGPAPRLEIGSFDELMAHEQEIIERIAYIPNGGNLFLINPLLLLEEAGVRLSDDARRELIEREPALSSVSATPYNALRASTVPQRVRVHLKGLFERR